MYKYLKMDSNRLARFLDKWLLDPKPVKVKKEKDSNGLIKVRCIVYKNKFAIAMPPEFESTLKAIEDTRKELDMKWNAILKRLVDQNYDLNTFNSELFKEETDMSFRLYLGIAEIIKQMVYLQDEIEFFSEEAYDDLLDICSTQIKCLQHIVGECVSLDSVATLKRILEEASAIKLEECEKHSTNIGEKSEKVRLAQLAHDAEKRINESSDKCEMAKEFNLMFKKSEENKSIIASFMHNSLKKLEDDLIKTNDPVKCFGALRDLAEIESKALTKGLPIEMGGNSEVLDYDLTTKKAFMWNEYNSKRLHLVRGISNDDASMFDIKDVASSLVGIVGRMVMGSIDCAGCHEDVLKMFLGLQEHINIDGILACVESMSNHIKKETGCDLLQIMELPKLESKLLIDKSYNEINQIKEIKRLDLDT